MDAAEPQVPQWVWVFDFHGYGLWDNNPSTVVAAAQFLPMHPNRLFKVLMLDAPTAFSAIWGVVSGFLTDITKAKITFTSLAELRDVAAGFAGDEVAAWLGVDDRHSAQVRYRYAQQRGPWSVRIEFGPPVVGAQIEIDTPLETFGDLVGAR
jgi:hypothetical protein